MTTNIIQAEQSVIGSILIDPRCLPMVEELLRPQDMAMEANREIYTAALNLRRRGEGIDPVLILRALEQAGSTVSRDYLMQLMDITPTAAHVREYAAITREAARSRGIAALAEEIKQRAEGTESAQELLSELIDRAADLQQDGTTNGLLTPMERVSRFFDHRDRVDGGTANIFVPTGYRDLDSILGGGMLSSGLYVLAARPAMGKTTLALNIAYRVAQKIGPVLFVSLEMDHEQLTAKLTALETGISGSRLLMKPLEEKEYEDAANALERQAAVPLYVNERSSETVTSIETLARQIPGLRLIVIDYLGKISPGDRGARVSRYEYTTEISGDLKTMARRFKIPVLVLCQLNRKSEERSDKRPNLADLRDTGAVEQDADGVIFLYRPGYYDNARNKNPYAPEETEVIVAKNRHGGVGECELAMCPVSSRFITTNNDPRYAYRQAIKAGDA